jgi:hypothetical protein
MTGSRQPLWCVRTLLSPLATSILRPPFYGVMNRHLLVTVTGRKRGKHYTAPSVMPAKEISCCWGSVGVGGTTYAGRAEAWTDETSMTQAYRTILAQHPTQARFMGITVTADGQPESYDIRQALQRGAAVVEIQVTPVS